MAYLDNFICTSRSSSLLLFFPTKDEGPGDSATEGIFQFVSYLIVLLPSLG